MLRFLAISMLILGSFAAQAQLKTSQAKEEYKILREELRRSEPKNKIRKITETLELLIPSELMNLDEYQFGGLVELYQKACVEAPKECLRPARWMEISCKSSGAVEARVIALWQVPLSIARAEDSARISSFMKMCAPSAPFALQAALTSFGRMHELALPERKSESEWLAKTFSKLPDFNRTLSVLNSRIGQLASAKTLDLEQIRDLLIWGTNWSASANREGVEDRLLMDWLFWQARFLPAIGYSGELAKTLSIWGNSKLASLSKAGDLPLPAFCAAWRESGAAEKCGSLLSAVKEAQGAQPSLIYQLSAASDSLKKGGVDDALAAFQDIHRKLQESNAPLAAYTNLFLAEAEIEKGLYSEATAHIRKFQETSASKSGLPWEKFSSGVLLTMSLRLSGKFAEAENEVKKYLGTVSSGVKGDMVVTIWFETEQLVLLARLKNAAAVKDLAARIEKSISRMPSQGYAQSNVAAIVKASRSQDPAPDIAALEKRFGAKSVEVRYLRRALAQISGEAVPK